MTDEPEIQAPAPASVFYSAATRGFYTHAIHGVDMPQDVVEITVEDHIALLNAQSEGKVIVPNNEGFPVAADPLPPSDEELAASARARRDSLLTDSDWIVIKSIEQSAPVPLEWAQYREALRTLPEQSGFPATINWPAKPQ